MQEAECPSCGAEVSEGATFCPSCGKPVDPSKKLLCDACRGAFPAAELERVGERMLCPLCRDREERRRAGLPERGRDRGVRLHDPAGGERRERGSRLSALAIVSLVSVLFCWPAAGLPTVILAVAALLRIRGSRGALSGTGLALAALVLGGLTLALSAVSVVALLPRFQTAWEDVQGHQVKSVMQRIRQAQTVHYARNGEYVTLEELFHEGELDPREVASDRYDFGLMILPEGFMILATPRPGKGDLHFLMDTEGVLRVERGRPALPDSPVWDPEILPEQPQQPVRRSSPPG